MSNLIAFNADRTVMLKGQIDGNTVTGSLYRLTGGRGRPATIADVTLKGQGKALLTFQTAVDGSRVTLKQFIAPAKRAYVRKAQAVAQG